MTKPVSRREARRQAVVLLYQRDVTGLPLTELKENGGRSGDYAGDPFSEALVAAVDADLAALDERITVSAKGWTVDRIAPLERNIIRVAAYEIGRARCRRPWRLMRPWR